MKIYQVYKLRFADGAEYVGVTRQFLKVRVWGHKHKAANADLTRRLQDGFEPEAITLSWHDTEKEAHKAEDAAILKLKNPINFRLSDGTKVRGKGEAAARGKKSKARRLAGEKGKWKLRSSEPTVCSICRRTLPAADFHADRSRYNGLSSKCKDCKREMDRMRDKQGKYNFNYADAKARCEAIIGKRID